MRIPAFLVRTVAAMVRVFTRVLLAIVYGYEDVVDELVPFNRSTPPSQMLQVRLTQGPRPRLRGKMGLEFEYKRISSFLNDGHWECDREVGELRFYRRHGALFFICINSLLEREVR